MATILVVDDEHSIRESLHFLLTSQGYDVETAASPGEAIAIASRLSIHLLIVDWMLGDDMDGLHVVQVLRKGAPTLPVIFVTGYHSASLEARIQSISNARLFSKPCPHDEFIAAVKQDLRPDGELQTPDDTGNESST